MTFAKYTQTVNWCEDPEVVAEIEALANRRRTSRADAIRLLIRAGLKTEARRTRSTT